MSIGVYHSVSQNQLRGATPTVTAVLSRTCARRVPLGCGFVRIAVNLSIWRYVAAYGTICQQVSTNIGLGLMPACVKLAESQASWTIATNSQNTCSVSEKPA